MNFLIALLISLHAAWALSSGEQIQLFDAMLAQHPDQIWAPTISENLKAAIHDYDSHTKLKNKLEYGKSVRGYALAGKCPQDIERDMKKLGCKKQVDVIREPKENKPILDKNGKTTPIWQFVCADGGVLKIKPEGDPMNKFTPFPHGSRTLRYPGNSAYRDYRDEVAKISPDGHIIPRSPGDLAPKNLVDGWSAEAHVPLAECKRK